MFGIIGAMKEEVASLTAHSKIKETQKIAGLTFYIGELSSQKIVVVQSGIGKVNAAMATQLLIDRYRVSEIIFTGLAGSGRSEIKIGDFVLADSLVQHDFDLTHFGREKGVIPGVGRFFETDSSITNQLSQVIQDLGREKKDYGSVHRGVVASGDCFVAEQLYVQKITCEFEAIAVEMEGAAVAQVCFLNKIPFAVLRTISDNADENAMADFQAVLDKASIEEFEILSRYLSLKDKV